ncbi:MAG: 2-hydroxy-acid oxidase [Rhodobacteraceae bacterium]|jgi:D-lactate dehydrogenase (cytochrome)|uniref:D-lactate dehydrogenase (cytochrome) n=1 Tax=Salipiger profundus TaxID=1229727 RepID=A0A1U7DAI0_9RHOB|nr:MULTISPECIES: FAD-linked oxidase C-terminal domain-containing protein [Salipiger]APX25139.1 D-lactate dehydrogenase (cytochrome) [Salipiger profundus]MAB05479.1 2-hydroxy-acid oxidase [Paracoccaceae bacterium]SFD09843.1 D-lactate dehydrogenase (cytochrome) [Salipiger profundus]
MTAFEALDHLLGSRFTTTLAARQQNAHNEAHYDEALPDAVAFPETTEEVAQILRTCAEAGVPVTPFGTGTSLEGQHLAVNGGVSLDFSRMNRILSVNDADMNVVVQPGVTRKQLNEELRATGLFFPIDPGADASLGGMAATRASGTTAVRYGTMRENVLALEAVMADGSVIRTGTAAKKSSAGYDLTHLLVGSEGTLGLITELTLKMHGQPEAVAAATCRFETVEDAVDCVILTIQSGIPMARIELVDEMMVRGFNLHAGTGMPEKPHLFLEFHGAPQAVAEQVATFRELAADAGAEGWQEAATTEERTALWSLRHGALPAIGALDPGAGKRTYSTDVCVPISRLAEAVAVAKEEARARGLICTIVGHVGDGNFHCGVRFDPADRAQLDAVLAFSGALAEAALRLGGTVTGEHGIGLGKQKYMDAEHGAALDWMRRVKTAFDPQGILNPGKLIPPES